MNKSFSWSHVRFIIFMVSVFHVITPSLPQFPRKISSLPTTLIQLHLEELEEHQVPSLFLCLVCFGGQVVLLCRVPEPRHQPSALRLILLHPPHQHRREGLPLDLVMFQGATLCSNEQCPFHHQQAVPTMTDGAKRKSIM